MKLTEADFRTWRFHRDAMHLNGGRQWFGYGHQCIDQPRLMVIDKYFRSDRSTRRSFRIDGKRSVDTLDEALAALSIPPELTDDERTLLNGIPDTWLVPDQRGPLLPLSSMGLIEFGRDSEGRVTVRRSYAGRVALRKGSHDEA